MAKLKHFATSVACVIGMTLTACGGGGGSSSSSSSSGTAGGGDGGVTPQPGTTAIAPSITTHPAATLSVEAGKPATFTVVATGSTPLTYQWKKNGTDIPAATSSTYTTPATSLGDNNAVFTVEVGNSAGKVTSNKATLTVTPLPGAPAIGTQPAALSVVAGQTASFTVAATGTAPLTYQWKKNGTDIAEATSSTYTTPATSLGDNNAVFTVEVGNSVSKVTSGNAVLTVTAVPVAPSIGTQPASQSLASGQAATFTVAATGTGELAYQWKRKNDGATEFANIPGETSSSYTLSDAGLADNGALFTVVVKNSVGEATSTPATLTVSAVVIGTQPAAQTVSLGSPVSLSVAATGKGTLTYQWKKNGVNVTTGEGATASTYSIPVTATEDSGEYSVVVSNGLGSATSNAATLTVSRYSLVAKTGGGTYELTECVKDLKTGLIWEGKNPPGSDTRASDTKYTNYYSWTELQGLQLNQSLVAEALVKAGTNSYGYAEATNGSGLCGFSSGWRMPEINELNGIVDFSRIPNQIDSTWFPNLPSAEPYSYCSRTNNTNPAFSLFRAMCLDTSNGVRFVSERDGLGHIRLVRCGRASPETCTTGYTPP